MIVKITQAHIAKARWCEWNDPESPEANPIRAALLEAGFEKVEFEIHTNQLPPRHDWQIVVDSTAYAMTYDCRDYVDRWRIEQGSRTKPADLILDDNARTADVLICRGAA